MSIAPFYKPSGDEVREMVKRNRENGEVEVGFEAETDEPQYYQHESAEAYQNHAQKLKMHALEMYRVTTSESTGQVLKVEEQSFRQIDTESVSENSSEVEGQKVELFIGNKTELTFSQPKVDKVVEQPQSEEKTIAEQAPSSLSEFVGDVDFMKWGKKGLGSVFGLFKGLFGGLLGGVVGTVKESTKVHHKKTESEQKAEAKKAKQNAEKSAFYARVDKAVAEARGASQAVVAKTLGRLGLAGMSGDMMNAYLGENRNLNSEEINVYTAFEIARKAEEAKKKQDKQVKDMQMAQSQGPAVNIDAAVEGGTGGGKANLSAVSAGG